MINSTKGSPADLSKQPKAQYNLQNPKKNQKCQGMEEERLSYLIPTITNG